MKPFEHLTVGILAIQGDFDRHHYQLDLLGASSRAVKLPGDLSGIDALIIPGGESTTMNIMIDRFGLRTPLEEYAAAQPVWGTCAGMIMLGMKIEDNQAGVKTLGVMDIDVLRNGYGRQVFSFEDSLEVDLGQGNRPLTATFIRAPRITRMGKDVICLAEYDDSPVLVREDNILASSFHTELSDDTSLLQYFLRELVMNQRQRSYSGHK